MAHPTTPALNTNHLIAFAQDLQLDGLLDTPLETVVNILLPILFIEVWLPLWEKERIDATVEVGVLQSQYELIGIVLDLLTLEARALRVTMMIGQTGRYLEIRRADLPLTKNCQ